MLENGLLEEAYKVYKSDIRTKAVMTPIGYKELFLYFENKMLLNPFFHSLVPFLILFIELLVLLPKS